MSKGAINQRLKFLIEKLSPSVRAFSEAIGDSSSNTQNYIGAKQTEPKPGYLSKVVNHFSEVNAHWLLTGNGEPFLTDNLASLAQTNISGDRNNVASGKNGKAIQKNYGLSDCEKERDLLKAQLDKAQREVELLTGQLQTKDALIASKEETIDLLKAAFNRPN